MAANVTLASMVEQAKLYADKRNDPLISDGEWARLLNNRAKQIYDLLVEARGSDYFATEATISIVAGTARYPLPANFYQLHSVTLEWGPQDHELVDPLMASRQRTPFANDTTTWTRYESKAYKLRASQIEFLPTPSTAVTCRLQYVPTFTELVNDNDTFDGVNGWELAIVLGAAIDAITVDKRPPATLVQTLQQQLDRIEALKSERDAEFPKQIVDVYPDGRRGARLLGLSPWDDTFDAYFGK